MVPFFGYELFLVRWQSGVHSKNTLKQHLGLLEENGGTHLLTAVFFVQVDTIRNGLDHCAALLKNVLQKEGTGCTY